MVAVELGHRRRGEVGFDIGWDQGRGHQRHGREKFYARFALRGGARSTSRRIPLRCIPQVHGAVRDAVEHARRVFDIELNAVTDNPLVFPDKQAEHVEEQVISAGHFTACRWRWR